MSNQDKTKIDLELVNTYLDNAQREKISLDSQIRKLEASVTALRKKITTKKAKVEKLNKDITEYKDALN